MTTTRSRHDARRHAGRGAKSRSGLRWGGYARLFVESLENRWLPSGFAFSFAEIGTLGGPTSQAYSINNSGQIVGKADIDASAYHAFLWENGVFTDLGTFGGTNSVAYDINSSGQITGVASPSDNTDWAFLWENGQFTAQIGHLGEGGTYGQGINDSGIIVGYSRLNGSVAHGFRWQNNALQDLGAIAPPTSNAFDINNLGVIVGATSTPTTPVHAAIAYPPNGLFQELPNSTFVGGAGSTAVAINDSGVIVGKAKLAEVSGPHLSFMWVDNVMTNMGGLPSLDGILRSSTPYKINNAGMVVGEGVLTTGTRHGYVYFNGAMYDLNSLIDPSLGFLINNAYGINDLGQIVGAGVNSQGVADSYVLTPNTVRLQVTATPSTVAGQTFDLTVTALNMFGLPVPSYTGTVSFSSSDFGALLPGSYTFTAGDEGSHTFTGVKLVSAGNQIIRVTDDVDASIIGTAEVAVSSADVASLHVAIPANAVAGVPTQITVTAVDAFSNLVSNYNGTVHFSSSDAQADLPPDGALTNGVGMFTVTLKTAGAQDFVINDVSNSGLLGQSAFTLVSPAAVSGFVVSGPGVTRPGKIITITVQAVDAFGNVASGYTGIVNITSSDPNAVLPSSAPLSGGTGAFKVVLRSSGLRTVTATDSDNASITGVSNNIQMFPGLAAHFEVSAPSNTTAGSQFSITVTARDAYGNVATDFNGTVTFSSSDVQAVLPPDSALTAGVGTFFVTLKTAGNHAVQAADIGGGPLFASANVAVSPNVATAFKLTLPIDTKTSQPFAFTVMAVDAFGNTATSYAGTVTFTSSGPSTLPRNNVLTNGIGVFSARLNTDGNHSITATDTVNSSITGSDDTSVGAVAPTAAASFAVSIPANAVAGTPVTMTVTALDASSNPATGYTGIVHFTSNDLQAVLPADAILSNGVGTFTVVFRTAGTRRVTVTDTANPAITAPSNFATVTSSTLTQLQVVMPSSTEAGAGFSVTINALDAYGNLVAGPNLVVRLSSSDSQGSIPPSAVLVNGTVTFDVTFKTAGNHTLVAKGAGSTLTGMNSLMVTHAAVADFVLAAPADAIAGSAFEITVVAVDAFGNPVTNYSGTVQFSSSDPQAVLPPNSTLTNGTGTFTVTLKSSDVRSVTATDGTIIRSADVNVSPAAAVSFNVTTSAAIGAGDVFLVVVEARDAFGNIATGYTGVVTFSSSDAQAHLPLNATLTSGVGIYLVVLKTAGSQSLTATDVQNPTITGSGSVTVNPGNPVQFVVSTAGSTDAGANLSVTVTALDAYGNVATGYNGAVFFSGNDYQAEFPQNATLTNGVGTFNVVLKTADVRTIAVTEMITGGVTGQTSVNVITGAMAKFILAPPPILPFAGFQFNMILSARDAFDNYVASYNGTVSFSSSDPNAVLPPASPVNNGLATFSFTLYKALTQTVTATDVNNPTFTGTAEFPVKPYLVSQYGVTGPTSVVAGQSFTVTVTAQDQYGNWNALYVPKESSPSKFANVTSSDPLAVYQSPIEFKWTDKGIVNVTVTLNTTGTQTITFTETTNSSITGTITIEVTAGAAPGLPGRVIRRQAPTPKSAAASYSPDVFDVDWWGESTKFIEPTVKTLR